MQIFTSPIHWTKATDFPKSTAHAIDFGPGGTSGIGPLMARNLEDRGIRVIVVGEKGPGGAEFYSGSSLKYDKCWADEYAPTVSEAKVRTVQA